MRTGLFMMATHRRTRSLPLFHITMLRGWLVGWLVGCWMGDRKCHLAVKSAQGYQLFSRLKSHFKKRSATLMSIRMSGYQQDIRKTRTKYVYVQSSDTEEGNAMSVVIQLERIVSL